MEMNTCVQIIDGLKDLENLHVYLTALCVPLAY